MSSDDYARATIRAGQDLGVSPRGIKIGLATNLVEAGPTSPRAAGPILMYANAKVPESLSLPHDDVGSDGYSVGTFQQQVRKGTNGAWWWADCATCMDPYKSARLFFTELVKLDYNNTSRSPGSFAQAVQKSAYPDRYDGKFSEASTLYDRLVTTTGGSIVAYYDSDRSSEFGFGSSRPTSGIVGICIHTTESGKSATATSATADSVTTYQVNSQTGSYHVMVGVDGKRIRQNTDDWVTWSTGNKGNNILLHLCFVGNASQTRAEWLAQDKMLRAGATVVKYWADKYGIPLKKVTAAGLPGILGHVDTRVWGGTDHTDPGANFPYDKLIEYAKGGTVAAPVINQIDAEAKAAASWIGDRIGSGEKDAARGGKFADFANGSIYWHPKVRGGLATAVPANILETWATYKWEQGALGYPTRRHTVVKDVGDIQAFEGGVIYRKYGQTGYPVRGVIGDRWAFEGYETGPLGWPTSDEYDNGTGGKRQDFENGHLEWDPSGAIKVVK
ncbi:N-acetylmuramoyl-L-alanine amidase [Gordonia sp. (in: high G+C Gram-positive bacteria)]|uniref:N-acetylmuramoyl-L-alanine amidase n=1 Tax=Gordonia sp. (in: high G+C Gram-positive bacteria) TaxID=84139 RepID=UPI003F951CFD